LFQQKTTREGGSSLHTREKANSADFALFELNVLLGHGIVFLHGQLLRHGSGVLLGDIKIPGIGGRVESDFNGDGFGHGKPSISSIGAASPREPGTTTNSKHNQPDSRRNVRTLLTVFQQKVKNENEAPRADI
jgi:hypothetical protein